MKKLFFYCFLTMPLGVFAQLPFDPTAQITQFASSLASPTGAMPIFDLGYANVKGSPFVIDDYCNGTLWMTKNRQFTEGYQFKYDETLNTVQAKNLKTGIELELRKDEVLALKLDYKLQYILFVTLDIPNNLLGEKCLMQVIYHSPKFSLMKKPSKSLEKVKRPDHSSDESYSIYKSSPDYFFRINKENYDKIRLTKKAFLGQLDNHKTALEKLFDSPDYKGALTEWKIAKALESIDNQ
jgi:hypothetical protein